jgi:hypothetical protein
MEDTGIEIDARFVGGEVEGLTERGLILIPAPGLRPKLSPAPVRSDLARVAGGLEVRAGNAYCFPMDDTPHHSHPADWEPPMPSEAELLAALARSDADIAAGRLVSASVVHEELSAAIERIEARRAQRHTAAGRR